MVASMRSLDQEVVHAHQADAFVDLAEQVDGDLVAGRRGQADVERLVEQHEVGVGRRCSASATAGATGRAAARGSPGRGGCRAARALQRLQLEAGAHLVEVAHDGHVGDDRLVAAVGVEADQTLGLEPLERLADGRAGHADERASRSSPRRTLSGNSPVRSLVFSWR